MLAKKSAYRVTPELSRPPAPSADSTRLLQRAENAEAALRRSEQRYQSLLKSMDEGYCIIEMILDAKGAPVDYRFLEVNPSFEQQTGLRDAVGKRMRDLVPDHDAYWFEIYGRVARTGEPVRFLNEARAMKRWFDVYASRLGEPEEQRVALLFTDITERKRTEAALRESEERFRAFVTTSSEVVYRMNADWSEMRHLVGKDFIADTSDPSRTWLQKYIYPEDQARVLAAIREAIRGKTSFALEHRVIRADGTLGWTASRAIPLLDANGEIVEWFGAASDVTESRLAESALRENELRYRTLFETMDEGFCVIEFLDGPHGPLSDYVHVEANPAYERHTGIPNVVGRKVREMVPDEADAWVEFYRNVLVTGAPIHFERELVATGRHLELSAFRIEPESRRQVAVLFQDVTGRKRAEQAVRESTDRFDIVRDGAQVGFWFCDLPFDELFWDNRVKDHFWLSPEARVTIDTFYQRIHPDDRQRTREAIADSIANKTRYNIEYRTVSPVDGREKWIRAMGRTSYGDQGQPVRFDGVTLDMTERRRAEEALREAHTLLADKAAHLEVLVQQRTAKLREIIGELEAFSYSIAHDMRAPLRSLQGFSDALLTDYAERLDAEGQSYLVRIAKSAGRMDKLISDVLSYSRVLRGEWPFEPVDVEQLLRGIADTYPMLASDKAEIVLEGEFPLILGSEAMLTQIFSNLLGNAVKFVREGTKPRIRVWAERRGERVRLFVQDNGIGIAPKEHEKIFGIFHQVGRGYEGTGIGLAIVKKSVDRMNGTVGVESQLGQGATFWVELQPA